MLEDRHLIRRLRRGDQAALRLIYEKYKDHMLTIAHNLLLDRALAEDCLHDVFVDLAVRAAEFRLRSSLKGYLVLSVQKSISMPHLLVGHYQLLFHQVEPMLCNKACFSKTSFLIHIHQATHIFRVL